MAEKTDEIITDTREYTNRPDFVVCAVRYLSDFLRKHETNADLVNIREEYRKYGTDMKLILVRVPVGLKEKWEKENPFARFQDFVRAAVTF